MLSLLTDIFSPDFQAAAEGTEITSLTPSFQDILSRFSVTESFVQSQHKGYTLNQIYSALLRSSIDQISYEEAISLIAPKEVNVSDSVTSSVYNSVYSSGLSDFIHIPFDPQSPVTKVVYGEMMGLLSISIYLAGVKSITLMIATATELKLNILIFINFMIHSPKRGVLLG